MLNRCEVNSLDSPYSTIVEAYCREQGLPVMLRIPFAREIAEGIAQGKTLVEIHPEIISLFRQLFIQIISVMRSDRSAQIERSR